jgi:hypothetical protein
MSSTRHAAPGGEFNQERYASSPALEKGLNALLVKNRCATLTDPRDIELVWFLQYLSYQPGGLEKLAADLLAAFPERLGTPAMHKIGAKPDGIYNADQVRAVRDEYYRAFDKDSFLLRGERRLTIHDFTDTDPHGDRKKASAEESKKFPVSYPVAAFLKICRASFLETVPQRLTQFCLDPAFDPEQFSVADDGDYSDVSVLFFHNLHGALLEYVERWEKQHLDGLIITEVGDKVLESLNYAESQRGLVLAQGNPRTGKTYIAKRWCLARPGKRRFVSLTEATSDKEFFREIAHAIGSSASYGFKTNELRERVNDVLQSGHLTLAIDEAHYLWPQRNFREALPKRINWVVSALNNYDVPVAMIATPQFTASQQRIEKNTHWKSAQLIGRISYCAALPDQLAPESLAAIARFHLPEASAESIGVLVDYATASQKHLAGIEQAVKAARHHARLKGRETITHADLMRAFDVTVTPSDAALAAATGPTPSTSATRIKRPGRIYAEPLQRPLKTISPPSPERETGGALVVSSDRSKRSLACLLPAP